MGTVYKSLIGEDDCSMCSGPEGPKTFSRVTSSGGTVTLARMGASLADTGKGSDLIAINGAAGDSFSVTDALSIWLDVRLYLPTGYVADGSVAYTSELQAGVTAAAAAGKPLYIPAGLTVASGTITMAANLWLIVDGTLKLAASTNGPLLTGASLSNVRISGQGTLDGNSANQASGQCRAVFFDTAATSCKVTIREITDFELNTTPGNYGIVEVECGTNVVMEGVELHHCTGCGFVSFDSYYTGTRQCYIHDITTGSGTTATVTTATDDGFCFSDRDIIDACDYSNISINRKRSTVNLPTSKNSGYTGINIGHTTHPADNSVVIGGYSTGNGLDGMTVTNSWNITVIGTELWANGANGGANDRDNFRTQQDVVGLRLIDVYAHDPTGYNNINLQSYNLVSSNNYKWTESVAKAGEWHVELLAGGDPHMTAPYLIKENGTAMTAGTLGALTAGQWAYGDNDSLGYSTVYVSMTATGDPDSQALGFLVAYPNGNHQFHGLRATRAHKYGLSTLHGNGYVYGAYIADNNQTAGNYAGFLNNGIGGWIFDNSIVEDTQTTATQTYGLWFAGGSGTATNVTVRRNKTAGIYETAGATVTKKGIHRSTDVLVGQFTATESSTTTVVTNANASATAGIRVWAANAAAVARGVGTVSSVSAGTSFTVTLPGAASAGTVYGYEILY